MDVARGNVPGSYVNSMFGERVTSGSETDIVITETGMPDNLVVPDSIQLSVVSSSASDTGVVKMRYLDGDLIERVEAIQLNGTTPVLTEATDIRAINNAYYVDGTNAVGNIAATNGGVRYFYIPAGSVQFNTTMQRVPAGKRLMVNAFYGGAISNSSGSSTARTVIKLETSFIAGDSFAEVGALHPIAAFPLSDSTTSLSGIGPYPVPEGEWVGLTASCNRGSDITAGYFGWMEDE